MEIKATMAGSVWKFAVQTGDQVEEDDDIVILESMKMEIPIPTEEAGIVKAFNVAEGDFVNEGDVIAVIDVE